MDLTAVTMATEALGMLRRRGCQREKLDKERGP